MDGTYGNDHGESMSNIRNTTKLIKRSLITELITRYLEERFIINLGVLYHDHRQDNIRVDCPDDEVIDKLIVYSYNDRLVGKKSNWHIQNAISLDFVENDLKE